MDTKRWNSDKILQNQYKLSAFHAAVFDWNHLMFRNIDIFLNKICKNIVMSFHLLMAGHKTCTKGSLWNTVNGKVYFTCWTNRCYIHLNPLVSFSVFELKTCSYWTENLLVPTWNLSFYRTWSCSGARRRQREGGAEYVPPQTAVRRLVASVTLTHLVTQLQGDDMASPRHFGRGSLDIANVMQKLQGKCRFLLHSNPTSPLPLLLQYCADSGSGYLQGRSWPTFVKHNTFTHTTHQLLLQLLKPERLFK